MGFESGACSLRARAGQARRGRGPRCKRRKTRSADDRVSLRPPPYRSTPTRSLRRASSQDASHDRALTAPPPTGDKTKGASLFKVRAPMRAPDWCPRGFSGGLR